MSEPLPSNNMVKEGSDPTALSSQDESQNIKREGHKLEPIQIILILLTLASLQVVSFTSFRLTKFEGFEVNQILPILGQGYFWLGVLCSGGVLIIGFILVHISETSFVLALILGINGGLTTYILLPIAWKIVFNEQIFSSMNRVIAFSIGIISAIGMIVASYIWNRGG